MNTSRRRIPSPRPSTLLWLALLTSCQPVRGDEGATAKSAVQPPDQEYGRTKFTTFELEGMKQVVTEKDGEAILLALLARLAQSELARRDDLLASTRNSDVVPEQDAMRLGGWVLSAGGAGLVLQYRFPPTPAGIEAYGAQVAKKQGTWTVGAVSMQHIHRRR